MRKKILFISTLFPYPLNNGGKIKTYNTLKMLSKYYDIDLVCYYEKDEELNYIYEIRTIVSSIETIKGKITTNDNKLYMCKLGIKSIFSKLPITVKKFFSTEFSQIVERKMEEEKYNKIYIDHLQISVNIKEYKNNVQYILDEHNCEYLIIKRKYLEEKNIIKKIFFKLEYMKLSRYERTILNKVNKVVALSENDKYELSKIGVENEKINVIPIPFSDGYKKDNNLEHKETLNILFVGTMSWMPNQEGVLWFLKKVVPKLRKENLKFKLYIVGKGSNKQILSYDNKIDIDVVGFVEDIDKYIKLCDCMIVPIFFGSGLRVKIIEAFSKKIPVISTPLGSEGLKVKHDENILIAKDEDSFYRNIKCMYNHELRNKLSENARLIFELEYSFKSIEKKFVDILEKGD